MVKVSVKWQKELFSELVVDEDQPPLVFKMQLYSLTGVPPERQKIMVKGGLLKDDGDWKKLAIKPGAKLMMMGTADEIPKAPEKAPMFVEDLPEDQQAGAFMKEYTAGLVNLGNTCYMNSTLQCLHSVPELQQALALYGTPEGAGSDSNHKLTLAAKELFRDLDMSVAPVAPYRYLMLLREKFPQFSQRNNEGVFMQQDAEECWSQVVYSLSLCLRETPASKMEAVVKNLFGIELVNRLKCDETDEETTETETVYTFKCHISQDVNFLHQGLKQGLSGNLEKNSLSLGRLASWTKTSLVARLPQYLTVQFVRFFWKKDTRQKAKILRPVHYPLTLDVFDLCTPEMQAALRPNREALREAEDIKAGIKRKGPEGSLGEPAPASAAGSAGEPAPGAAAGMAAQSHDVEMKEAAPTPKARAGAETADGPGPGAGIAAMVSVAAAPGAASDTTVANGASASGSAGGAGASSSGGDGGEAGGSSATGTSGSTELRNLTKVTGHYDLTAVLTHKGRSADSGHYVAWVKQDGKWVEYDDDKPIPTREEDILKLSGGGDWHMAYICIYKARVLE